MRLFISLLSAFIIIGSTIPYAIDVIKGRAKPARGSRFMFMALLVIALFQQRSLDTGYALFLTLGEAVSTFALLGLAVKYGVGGLRKLDVICYSLLFIDLIVWKSSGNALLALHLTVIADIVAVWPTLHKTWHDHKSETPLFYWAGVVAPLLAIAAEENKSYQTLLFPAYLAVANLAVVLLIYGFHTKYTGRHSEPMV